MSGAKRLPSSSDNLTNVAAVGVAGRRHSESRSKILSQLQELKIQPGNRLEAFARDRKGQFSIRINDQWRVCFTWSAGNAGEVEIVDYHRG